MPKEFWEIENRLLEVESKLGTLERPPRAENLEPHGDRPPQIPIDEKAESFALLIIEHRRIFAVGGGLDIGSESSRHKIRPGTPLHGDIPLHLEPASIEAQRELAVLSAETAEYTGRRYVNQVGRGRELDILGSQRPADNGI